MTKKSIAILLSLFIAAVPFLGFPEEIDRYIYLGTGLIVAGLIELVSIQYCSQCGQLCTPTHENLDKYQDPRTGVVDEAPIIPSESEEEVSDYNKTLEVNGELEMETYAKIGGEIHKGRRRFVKE